MSGGQRDTRENACDRADQKRSGLVGAGEADRRADDHHALDAEIEDARTLRHEFAQRGQR